jgi:hypothetical protein
MRGDSDSDQSTVRHTQYPRGCCNLLSNCRVHDYNQSGEVPHEVNCSGEVDKAEYEQRLSMPF